MRRTTPWILWWATGVHAVLGLTLLMYPPAASIAILVGLTVFASNLSYLAFAALLILASVSAAWALAHESHMRRGWILVHLFPQYFLVLTGLLSNSYILAVGEFNGRPFEFWTALAGLWPVMLAAILHTAGVLERYFLRWAN